MDVTTTKICRRIVFFQMLVRNSAATSCCFSKMVSHGAKSTVEFMQPNVPNFTELSVWPWPDKNRPDLNPVNYAVWGALQQTVYRVPIMGLDDLKNRVCTFWASLDEQLISKAVDQWRPRLKAVVQVHRGHIEQLFTWLSVVVCCCYLSTGISMHCCCVLPFWQWCLGALTLL